MSDLFSAEYAQIRVLEALDRDCNGRIDSYDHLNTSNEGKDASAIRRVRLGKMYHSVDDVPASERMLSHAAEWLASRLRKSSGDEEVDSSQRVCACVALACVQCDIELGLIWHRRSDCSRARPLLERALAVLERYCKTSADDEFAIVAEDGQNRREASSPRQKRVGSFGPCDVSCGGCGSCSSCGVCELCASACGGCGGVLGLEEAYTACLFWLAQVYGQLGNKERSAEMCLATLQRQLASRQEQSRSDAAVFCDDEWTTNVLHLSTYYVVHERFYEAFQCLRSVESLLSSGDSEDQRFLGAALDIGWVKFHVAILESALRIHELVLAGAEPAQQALDDDDIPDADGSLFPGIWSVGDAEQLRANLMLVDPVRISEQFEYAKLHTELGCQRVDSALAFFTVDEFVTEHCQALIDRSDLMALLCSWERDRDVIASQHALRAGLFLEIVEDLSSEHFWELLVQLLFHVGEAYMQSASARLQLLDEAHSQDAEQRYRRQARDASVASISFFEKLVRLFYDNQGHLNGREKGFDMELVRAMIWLAQGIVRAVFISLGPTEELAALQRAYHWYEKLFAYADGRDLSPTLMDDLCVARQLAAALRPRITLLKLELERREQIVQLENT